MTENAPQMPPARRRPIPGMSPAPAAPPPPTTSKHDETRSATAAAVPEPTDPAVPTAQPSTAAASRARARSSSRPSTGARRDGNGDDSGGQGAVGPRRPAADYTTTRLVNFRIPVDLHDRYRQLVREAEDQHPRLRRPSLTELVIALLEEGPETASAVAELIRRKRAAEHASGGEG
jgi:hypothetical protein